LTSDTIPFDCECPGRWRKHSPVDTGGCSSDGDRRGRGGRSEWTDAAHGGAVAAVFAFAFAFDFASAAAPAAAVAVVAVVAGDVVAPAWQSTTRCGGAQSGYCAVA